MQFYNRSYKNEMIFLILLFLTLKITKEISNASSD